MSHCSKCPILRIPIKAVTRTFSNTKMKPISTTNNTKSKKLQSCTCTAIYFIQLYINVCLPQIYVFNCKLRCIEMLSYFRRGKSKSNISWLANNVNNQKSVEIENFLCTAIKSCGNSILI